MFRKHKQILLLAIVVLSGAMTAFAQEPVKLSLQEALKLAMQNNTNILNSELDLKMAQKKVWETTANGLPQISGKGSYSHIFKVPTLSFGGKTVLSNTEVPWDPTTQSGTMSSLQLLSGENIYLNSEPGTPIELGLKNNTTFDLTLSQLIFSGSYIVGLQATKVYYGLTKQTAEKTRLDVIETVTNTYTMIQLAEESKKILGQNLENINKTLYEISEMNKQGFLEKTDVDQLEVTANTIRNALNQIDSNLNMAYRLLKIQLGLDDAAKIELIDSLESGESLTTSSLSLISETFNIDQNVDYQLIQTSEKAAKLELNLAKSAFLPTIAGFYNHTEKLKAPAFDFAPKDLIGLNLSLPIFSSGQRMSVVSQKKMALEKAKNTRMLVSSSLVMQAGQYQSDLKLKLERFQNQKKSAELSDDIYQRTLEKYKQGMASSMDLMTSQNQYLSNLTNYYQTIYDVLGAKSKLEKMFNINQDTEK
ncbi:MAG: TolC family protein [Prolixibacteraceae bacterium]|nr:TolC family protein [Prolixibacteraceae bacterium]